MVVILRHTMFEQLLATLACVVICINGTWQTSAQESSPSVSHPPSKVENESESTKEVDGSFHSPSQQPVNCEDVSLYIDEAIIKVRKIENTYLIVIARLGTGERSRQISRIRLNSIENYLKRFPDIKYVTAEGSNVKGLGQIELYVGGHLLRVLPVRKNAKSFCPEPVG